MVEIHRCNIEVHKQDMSSRYYPHIEGILYATSSWLWLPVLIRRPWMSF